MKPARLETGCSTPSDRFRSLAKRLVAVPKTEVDGKAAEMAKKPRKKRTA
jgi:hypothetical protein